jgi:Zn-dependent metalloprotease
MGSSLPGDAEVVRDPLWGTVRHLDARELSRALDRDPEFRALRDGGDAPAVALFFLAANRALLRLADPRRELDLDSVTRDGLGFAHVKLKQVYEGLPVWGREVQVHLDAELEVYRVDGRYVATPERLETRPHLGPAEARSLALEALGPGVALDETSEPELLLFPAESGELILAYRLRTPAAAVQGWQILIDASNGHVLEKISTVMPSGVGTLRNGESSL